MNTKRISLSKISYFVLMGLVVLAACAPAATPEIPTAMPPAAAPPTAVPPTAVPPTAGPTQPPAATAVPVAALALAKNDTLGSFIADKAGNSLYLFTKDTKDASNCYDKCATAWPPLLTSDKPAVGDGLDASLVGTTQRKDGSMQVTYNGWPLYYYAADQKAGDVAGQAVGKVWWVISGEGWAIKPAALQLASNDQLGKFLADGEGRSLYLFTKDTKDTSNCYGKCEAAWPPLLTTSTMPTVTEGITTTLIGTTQRKDGSTQLTYNGWPLYYFAADLKPGDVNGQAVGKVWWVISGEGWGIKPAALQLASNDQLGKFLADGEGRSLYLFTKDTKDTSNCYGKCETAWPPLLTTSTMPTVTEGMDATLIGTTKRKDGSTQLTYNGWPLYYFAADLKPGDVNGQAVGKVWWVISGEGWGIKPAALQLATDTKLGKFLADADGRSLYIFTKDTKDTSNCYGKCETAWPPLLQSGKPTVGDGVDATLLGTTQRKDGSVQVTFAGMPLYYYAADQKAGDVTGQGVGTVWYIIGGDGKVIK